MKGAKKVAANAAKVFLGNLLLVAYLLATNDMSFTPIALIPPLWATIGYAIAEGASSAVSVAMSKLRKRKEVAPA